MVLNILQREALEQKNYKVFIHCQSPEPIIKKYLSESMWNYLTTVDYLSEEFFRRHFDKSRPCELTYNPAISEKFLEEYYSRLVPHNMQGNPNVSEAFFRRHSDDIEPQYMLYNANFSEQFLEEKIDEIKTLIETDMVWDRFRYLKNITDSQERDIRLYVIVYRYRSTLSGNPGISEAFAAKYLDFLVPRSISSNPAMSEQFFEKHPEIIDWGTIEENTNISENFFRCNIDKLSFDLVISNEIHPRLLR